MIAILIHYLGFYVVNAMIPAWAVEVDGELASTWYLCFMLIDVIALTFVENRRLLVPLALSCSWSVSIALETFFLSDWMQSFDWAMQGFLDAWLLIAAMGLLIEWLARRSRKNSINPRFVA
jgi:hypothetical protein